MCATLGAAQAGQQPAPADPAPAAGQQPPAGGRAGGQGGGRGNAAATLFTATCAPCHGTDLAGGRAPTLFSERLLTSNDDETLAAKIRDGVPNTAMQPFKGTLDDQQIWQLVAYIRTTAASLKDKPVFVPDPNNQTIKSEKQTFRIEVVAPGLETPWGLAFLPDGRLLVTERQRPPAHHRQGQAPSGSGAGHAQGVGTAGRGDARRRHSSAVPQRTAGSISPIPKWFPDTSRRRHHPPPPAPAEPAAAAGGRGRGGRGGAPSPPSMTVFVRGKIDKTNHWVEEQVLYRAPSELYTPSGSHYGARFLFDRTGHLFYTLGERGDMTNAQDLSKPLGKIHRVNDDGSIPKDNPFVNTPNALPSIWTYGHRNPQGLAWDSTGLMWESEHGPTGGDEINVIEKGKNYGWGVISMGLQNGITERSHEGMEQPIVVLHADDRAERHRVLHRLEVPGLEEQPVRRRAGGTAAAAPRDQRAEDCPPGGRVPAVRPRPRRDDGSRRPPLCTVAESDRRGHGGRAVGLHTRNGD